MSKTEKHNVLIVGSKLEKIAIKDNLPILYLPTKIPMIVTPKLYSRKIEDNKETEILGGYLLNDQEYTDNLIKQKWDMNIETILLKNNTIYNMVNNINSVSYKINIKVLDFIKSNYKKYNLLIDKDFIHPLSLKTKLKYNEKIELESFLSIKDLEQNILGLANIFSYIPKFYLPVRLDFRGRINCISEYLNYQGSELAKALLLFSEGEKVYKTDIKSINFLKIFGANCFGLSKSSYNQRIEWVDSNLNNIIKLDQNFIFKADSPLLFLSSCLELIDYINNPNEFKSRLPIYKNATCSGLQPLSSMLNDSNLAKHVNIIKSNRDELPNDVYAMMVDTINHEINEIINKKPEYANIGNLKINIKFIKRDIMTIPYGATIRGIFNQLKSDHFYFYKI
uniref:DNA-directed RNA polymerase n=1 Tax=Clavaria fumosa TaxID=264083 RepID=A0A7T3U557_9AGAR|nr:DNA-directed RNA polymerase [Clavaria fumosa]QPZ51118.1 DNA-directed RNA polymerase [Clavaria fumosa]